MERERLEAGKPDRGCVTISVKRVAVGESCRRDRRDTRLQRWSRKNRKDLVTTHRQGQKGESWMAISRWLWKGWTMMYHLRPERTGSTTSWGCGGDVNPVICKS